MHKSYYTGLSPYRNTSLDLFAIDIRIRSALVSQSLQLASKSKYYAMLCLLIELRLIGYIDQHGSQKEICAKVGFYGIKHAIEGR